MPDLINEVISPVAFKQLDDAILKLVECTNAVTKLATEAKTVTFEFKGIKDLSALSDLLQKCQGMVITMTDAQKNLQQATVSLNNVQSQYTKSVQDNADALAQQKLELAYVDGQLKILTKDIQEGKGQIDQNNAKLADWTRRQQELKVEIGATTSALKSEIKELQAAAGSLDAMEQQLGQMRDQYRALSKTMRGSPFGKELSAEIEVLDAQVKELNASMGNNQKNVGNYASGWEKLGGIIDKMGLRFIAQMAVFQVIFQLMKELGDEYQKWSDRINYQQVAMAEVAKQSANAFGQEAAAIEAMKDRFFDLSTTMEGKKEIVDELNDKYENQIGHLNGIADAEKFFKDKSTAFIKALELRAQATAALSVITEEYKKQLIATANPEETLNTFNKFGAGVVALGKVISSGNAKNFFEEFEWEKVTRGAGKADQTIQDTSKSIDFLLKEYTKLQNEANKLDKANGFNTDQVGGKLPKAKKAHKAQDLTNETLKAEQDLTKELYSEYAKRLLIDAETQRAIVDEESNSLSDRITAYRKYTDLILRAKSEQLSAEYDETEAALSKIADIEAKAVGKRTNEEKALLLKKEVYKQREASIVAQYDFLQVQSANETTKGVNSIYDKEVKYRLSALEKIKVNNDSMMQGELEALQQKYGTEILSEEVYQQKVQAVKDKYAKKQQQGFIGYLKEQIDALEKQGVDVSALNAALDKAQADMAKSDNEADKRKRDLKVENLKKVKDLSIQFAEEAASAIVAIQDAQFEQQQIQLNKQKQSEDIYYEDKRRAIEASAGWESDKAAKLQDLNAQQAASESAMREKQKQLDIAKAKFDRDAAIANIIAKGAEAIAATLPMYANPATVPFAIAQDAIIAGITAAQIAKAASAPLPQYRMGTDNHKGGAFIAGDGGEKELIAPPNKAAYWSNQFSTLYSEAAGTKVIPMSKIVKQIGQFAHVTNAMTHEGHIKSSLAFDAIGIIKSNEAIGGEIVDMKRALAYAISHSRPIINIKSDSKLKMDNSY